MGRYTEQLGAVESHQDIISEITGATTFPPIKLMPETDNPDDPRAIKAVTLDGRKVGNLDPGSWLVGAMLDENRPVASRIMEVRGGDQNQPLRSIMLEVLTDTDATEALAGKAKVLGQASKANAATQTDAKPKAKGVASVLKLGCLVVGGLLLLSVVFGAINGYKPNPDLQRNAEQANTEKSAIYPAPEPSSSNGPEITAAEFAQIQPGMRYSKVMEIVGSPGEIVSDSQVANYRLVMVKWQGTGFGANAIASFENGKLINKTQIGLH